MAQIARQYTQDIIERNKTRWIWLLFSKDPILKRSEGVIFSSLEILNKCSKSEVWTNINSDLWVTGLHSLEALVGESDSDMAS